MASSDQSTPQPARYLDELAHAGSEHLDAAYVEGYDHKARVNPRTELSHLQDLGLGQASTLVDLGAGTGTMALAAAPLCHRVIAINNAASTTSNACRPASSAIGTRLGRLTSSTHVMLCTSSMISGSYCPAADREHTSAGRGSARTGSVRLVRYGRS
jgi:hypothetical protein